MAVFHRPDLAQKITQLVLSNEPGSSASSGVFLSAPRRTGKSTFLREDLFSAIDRAGALAIYIDLWADRSSDPGHVMTAAIMDEVFRHDNLAKKTLRSLGVDRVKLAGFEINMLKDQGLSPARALGAALSDLSAWVKKPIVLIIDEAQHALTSQAGSDALFALKAARDALNTTGSYGLRILATGSNQDKLAMLRNDRGQAFFGAPLHAFPHLGRDYVDWLCEQVDLGVVMQPNEVYPLFEKTGFRPELLNTAIDSVRYQFDLPSNDAHTALVLAVDEQIDRVNEALRRVIRSLTPLQTSVLRVLAQQGERYAPFEASTMNEYRQVLSAIAPQDDVVVDTSNVQSALTALQEKELIWRERRGVYALEDIQIKQAMTQSVTPRTEEGDRGTSPRSG